jgi:site-specific recombinase XerD
MNTKSSNKGLKLPVETLTPAEVAKLLGACNKGDTGVRNQALIVTLYRAGLRISEALALLPKDLDAEASTVRVLHGKGDKARLVGIDAGALTVIQRWLDKRAALGISAWKPIFCTLEGGSVSPDYVRGLMKRLARKAGIVKRVHAHGLRHTHASELRAEGTDIGIIQGQLGHSNLQTTVRYLNHVAPQAVIDAIKAREWTPPA